MQNVQYDLNSPASPSYILYFIFKYFFLLKKVSYIALLNFYVKEIYIIVVAETNQYMVTLH